MITRSMVPEYLKYILPTTLTFTLAGVYGIIDGIFVGHAVGDAGLAGINVAYPLVCFILAVGTGLGMGGGVISSIARGRGDAQRSKRVIGVTLFMLVVASLPILAVYLLCAEQLCRALGGQGETLSQAVYYLKVVAFGAPFQVLVTGCTPLIRNKGMVAFAMCVQVFAGLVNVVLDYLFVVVWQRGTAGAAEATVVAQIIAFLFVLGFFLHRDNRVPLRDFIPDGAICAHIVKLGAAPFGLTLLPEVSTVVNNVSLSYYGGETALAAYAAIAYVAYFVQIVIQSVGDGSQPLISRAYGAGDFGELRRTGARAYRAAFGITAVCIVALFLTRSVIGVLFGASAEANAGVTARLPLFLATLPLLAYTRVTIAYFYATEKTALSYVLVFSEPVLTFVVLLILPQLLKLTGVWLAIPAAQALTFCIAVPARRRTQRARELPA